MEEASRRLSRPELADARIRIPEHVLHRNLATETVLLNARTGKYHSLNPSGGRMLELLEELDTVGDAAERLAAEYGRSPAEVEPDLWDFCTRMVERGLIELLPAESAGGA